MNKLIVGERYIPIKKSIGVSMAEAASLRQAKEMGQEFLYYQGISNVSTGKHKFSAIKGGWINDHYLPEDVVPYIKETENMTNLIVGEKYVPLKKSSVFIGLESSVEWRKAQEKGQDYLYYNGVRNDGIHKGVHLFSSIKGGGSGSDFFNPDDVIPYVEEKKELVLGAKYTPLKKTNFSSLDDSIVWEEAKEMDQNYLYYCGYDGEDHMFNYRFIAGNGDFFNEDDVVPYVEELIIGEKYVPLKKSIGRIKEECASIREMEDLGNEYLYYLGANEDGYHKFGPAHNKPSFADWFLPDDVIPYTEPIEEVVEPVKTTKLVKGNKYVPIRKTVGDIIERSGSLHRAKINGQNYLYYNGTYDSIYSGKVHVFGYSIDDGGDYYNEDDVVPYAERFEEIDRINVVYK